MLFPPFSTTMESISGLAFSHMSETRLYGLMTGSVFMGTDIASAVFNECIGLMSTVERSFTCPRSRVGARSAQNDIRFCEFPSMRRYQGDSVIRLCSVSCEPLSESTHPLMFCLPCPTKHRNSVASYREADWNAASSAARTRSAAQRIS
jgi:hypothetical protein